MTTHDTYTVGRKANPAMLETVRASNACLIDADAPADLIPRCESQENRTRATVDSATQTEGARISTRTAFEEPMVARHASMAPTSKICRIRMQVSCLHYQRKSIARLHTRSLARTRRTRIFWTPKWTVLHLVSSVRRVFAYQGLPRLQMNKFSPPSIVLRALDLVGLESFKFPHSGQLELRFLTVNHHNVRLNLKPAINKLYH